MHLSMIFTLVAVKLSKYQSTFEYGYYINILYTSHRLVNVYDSHTLWDIVLF